MRGIILKTPEGIAFWDRLEWIGDDADRLNAVTAEASSPAEPEPELIVAQREGLILGQAHGPDPQDLPGTVY